MMRETFDRLIVNHPISRCVDGRLRVSDDCVYRAVFSVINSADRLTEQNDRYVCRFVLGHFTKFYEFMKVIKVSFDISTV